MADKNSQDFLNEEDKEHVLQREGEGFVDFSVFKTKSGRYCWGGCSKA